MTGFPPRVLSIKQPWVWAILELGKDVENRTWGPPAHIVGSRILLHASLRPEAALEIDDLLHPVYDGARHIPRTRDLPLGYIVGSVRVTGFVQERLSRWYVGPYGWTLEDPRGLEEPVRCRGRLGLWSPEREILTQIPESHWTA